MNQDYDIEKIEAFILEEMQPDERAAFQQEINNDETLREEVSAFRQILTGFEGAKVKNMTRQWESEFKTNKQQRTATVRPINMFRRRAIAAAVALLVLATGWWVGTSGVTDDALYATHYSDDSAYENIKSGGEGTASPLQQGYDAYKNGDYEAAIQFFTGVAMDDEYYNTAQFMLGHAKMQKGDFDGALGHVSVLGAGDDIRYRDEAQWMTVLCFLKSGDEKGAKATLNSIISDDRNPNQKRGKELYNSLTSIWRQVSF